MPQACQGYRQLLPHLLPEKPSHSPQYTVLLWVVGVILAWNFEQSWECCCICIDSVAYPLSNVLIDQQDSNILSLGCEPFKSFFDSRIIRLAVNDKEVFLRVRGLCDMTNSS